MTEPDKSRNDLAKLSCQWGEDEAFDVNLKQAPPDDGSTVPDTTFLLKPGPPVRSTQYPAT